MLESVFVVLGLLIFFDELFYVKNIWETIDNYLVKVAEKTKLKFLFNLSKCDFCKRVWMSIILTLIFALLNDVESSIYIVPFTVAGIYSLIVRI